MEDLKIGDRVRVKPGPAIPFVGHEGTVYEVQPHHQGVESMAKHVVVFEHREKRAFYRSELVRISKGK
jgi:ribosomal protein L24